MRALSLCAVLTLPAALFAATGSDVTGTFDFVAEVHGSQGTRSMPLTISVRQPISLGQAGRYRQLLRNGGQAALLNDIRNLDCGRLVVGALEYPLNIVVAERKDDSWKYTVVTARSIKLQEFQFREPSLDFPFTVAVFEVPDMQRGEGLLVPRAALYADDDGFLHVENYQGETGRIKDVKRR